MNEHGRNETDIFRYTDVEYTPDGYSDVYRWDDFLGIAGGHVLSAKCIVDSVSPGGDRHPADLAKAASAAANRTAGSHADEAGGIKH